MIVATVMYPKSEHSRFDFDYYLTKHIPLLKERLEPLGLKGVRLMHGTGMSDGSSPVFEVVAELEFSSLEALRDAFARHGGELMADIPNYTNVQPGIQFNELM
jgi:uncharacterized protein (TIGR02118 family)